ncbi:MAG: helix-turn-helix domain-containing protein [Bacteroidetes bacterium]|nr:helix-turn-helix domain-containing protein [Bacteroidota bacterium]MCL5738441.1 helix-turn-helix domain-containing protein [Bacteroidota bacterium]
MSRKSPYTILLTQEEKQILEKETRKYTSPYFRVVRAKIALYAAEGMRNDEIARRVDLPRQIVSKWRKRFFEKRLLGLEDEARQGRPPAFSPSSRN